MKAKRILIPSDFSVGSLNILKNVLRTNTQGQVFDVVLLRGMYRSDDLSDLLFTPKYKLIQSVSSPDFEEAIMVIKNKYESSIRSIQADIFTGYNQVAFNNYAEGMKIDEAYVADANISVQKHKNTFDVSGFIRKSELKIKYIEVEGFVEAPERGQIAEILLQGATSI